MRYLRQSTTTTIKIGPFVDSTDGYTAETALTISQADVRLSKNGGDFAQKNQSTSATHDESGYYDCLLDATDTNTAGRLEVAVSETGALPRKQTYHVLPAAVYDAWFGTTQYRDSYPLLRSAGTLIEATNKQTTRNTGLGVPDTGRTFLMGGNRMRISHPGKVEWITYYVWEKTGVTAIIPRVFRYNGATWDQVGSDGDTITGPWSTNDTWYTHTLASPIEGVRAGDCLALYAIATPSQFDFFGAVNGLDADDFDLLYAESNITGSGQTFGLSVASTALMGTCKIQSPVIALAGDSFAAGKDVSNSFLAPQEIAGNWKAVAAANGIAGELYTLDSIFATINCGLGSTTALNWETYFATYVLPKYPKVCIWSLGANDYALRGGQAARGIFLTSLRNVFGLCRDNGILPVMLTILHTSDATLDYKFGWNVQIKKLCADLNVPVIDGFKILADPQNEKQRLAARYGSGTHPNAAGYKALAAAIVPTLLGLS